MSTDVDPTRPASVAVLGLWHLGVVSSACLAQAGLSVVALDPHPAIVDGLDEDRLQMQEPGPLELLREQAPVRSARELATALQRRASLPANRRPKKLDFTPQCLERLDGGARDRLLAALTGHNASRPIATDSALPAGIQ